MEYRYCAENYALLLLALLPLPLPCSVLPGCHLSSSSPDWLSHLPQLHPDQHRPEPPCLGAHLYGDTVTIDVG